MSTARVFLRHAAIVATVVALIGVGAQPSLAGSPYSSRESIYTVVTLPGSGSGYALTSGQVDPVTYAPNGYTAVNNYFASDASDQMFFTPVNPIGSFGLSIPGVGERTCSHPANGPPKSGIGIDGGGAWYESGTQTANARITCYTATATYELSYTSCVAVEHGGNPWPLAVTADSGCKLVVEKVSKKRTVLATGEAATFRIAIDRKS